ncbi:MAG: LTA synthase family protein [Ferruginibacter sp.]
MNNNSLFRGKYAPVFIMAMFVILISFLTRVCLLIGFGSNMNLSFAFVGSFFIGLLYDIIVSAFIVIPFVLQVTFTNNFIYTKKGMVIGISFFLILLFILFFTNIFPRDYNKDLYKAAEIFVSVRFAFYLLLCTQSQHFRMKWRTVVLQFWVFLIIFLLLFNAISEIVFWDEFYGRYNFIAVDYLIYTNEVIGNIRESYPVPTIVISVLIATIIFFLPVRKKIAASVRQCSYFFKRLIFTFCFLLFAFLLAYVVSPGWISFSANNYANELSGNGVYQFVQAFKNNELDFYKYYKTIPDSTAFNTVRKELAAGDAVFTPGDDLSIERLITSKEPERKLNVIMISVESLSGSFMKAFGGTKNITPCLDSIADHSLFFTNTYASGTRTVRGLEALALSIPPTPGQSIVKRPGNENLFSLGSVFRSKGYITQYIYGGYGYFDNMNYFFSHNGYDVIDRSALKPEEIHYANIWGVADEDLFDLSLRTMDDNYSKGKPFFSQIMTVSNHRPFTYPDGRIDIPSSSQSREGGVKYTDYAIGRFIKQASAKPWFANTVFVIVADHCAQSAGSAYLPVTGYHIPLIIYSPTIMAPRKIETLTGQIDIPPTILGLCNFTYKSKFFGQDVLDSIPHKQKAFISTYQGLGFIEDDKLVVQSPVKKISMFQPDFNTGSAAKINPIDSLEQKAISFYQVAAWLVRNKKYGSGN